MTDVSPDLDPYVAEHVHEALARDPRVSELGVDVEIDGETVVLRGTVTSLECQEAVTNVVRELLPRHRIRNETTVAEIPETTEVEHIP